MWFPITYSIHQRQIAQPVASTATVHTLIVSPAIDVGYLLDDKGLISEWRQPVRLEVRVPYEGFAQNKGFLHLFVGDQIHYVCNSLVQ